MTKIFVLTIILVFSQQPCTDCTDPSRPWMRGSIEYYCSISAEAVEQLKRDNPGKADKIKLCHCEHMCDPEQKETDGRKWDAKCEARCNPNNCNCPHPCD